MMSGISSNPVTPAFASRITGTGSAFPARALSNQDLAQQVDTSNEWILERTGIQSRFIAEPGNPEESNSSLAWKAALKALEMANKQPEEIDQIVYATCTPDTLIPSSACWLQKKLGAHHAWGMDINAACSGFVFALSVAQQFIYSGQSKTVLVIGSDILSAFTNWEDRTSCILFGDAAGAVIVERTDLNSPHRILSTHLKTDGRLHDLFHIPAGGSFLEITPEVYEKKLHKMHMKGKEIFKSAVRTLTDYALEALNHNGISIENLDWFIPHQANLRIIEAVAQRLEVSMDQVLVNLDRCGNTSSATVPTVLDAAVRSGKIQPGQTVLFDVFGAGLTYGSLLLRW